MALSRAGAVLEEASLVGVRSVQEAGQPGEQLLRLSCQRALAVRAFVFPMMIDVVEAPHSSFGAPRARGQSLHDSMPAAPSTRGQSSTATAAEDAEEQTSHHQSPPGLRQIHHTSTSTNYSMSTEVDEAERSGRRRGRSTTDRPLALAPTVARPSRSHIVAAAAVAARVDLRSQHERSVPSLSVPRSSSVESSFTHSRSRSRANPSPPPSFRTLTAGGGGSSLSLTPSAATTAAQRRHRSRARSSSLSSARTLGVGSLHRLGRHPSRATVASDAPSEALPEYFARGLDGLPRYAEATAPPSAEAAPTPTVPARRPQRVRPREDYFGHVHQNRSNAAPPVDIFAFAWTAGSRAWRRLTTNAAMSSFPNSHQGSTTPSSPELEPEVQRRSVEQSSPVLQLSQQLQQTTGQPSSSRPSSPPRTSMPSTAQPLPRTHSSPGTPTRPVLSSRGQPRAHSSIWIPASRPSSSCSRSTHDKPAVLNASAARLIAKVKARVRAGQPSGTVRDSGAAESETHENSWSAGTTPSRSRTAPASPVLASSALPAEQAPGQGALPSRPRPRPSTSHQSRSSPMEWPQATQPMCSSTSMSTALSSSGTSIGASASSPDEAPGASWTPRPRRSSLAAAASKAVRSSFRVSSRPSTSHAVS